MADLYTVSAPLLLRLADGTRHVLVEVFRQPQGLVYFRPFWDSMPREEGVQLLPGEVRGEGPWKVGDAVVTVLGCHGTDPEEAAEYARWQSRLEQLGADYPARDELERIARQVACRR